MKLFKGIFVQPFQHQRFSDLELKLPAVDQVTMTGKKREIRERFATASKVQQGLFTHPAGRLVNQSEYV